MLNESEQKPTKSSLIVMEKEEQKWDQELQVEEKEEDSLKLRRSRDPNGGNPFQSSAAAVAEEDSTELNKSNGSSKTNGHLVHPSKSVIDNVVVDESVVDKSEEKEVPADPENFVAPSDNGVHKEAKLKEGNPKSNNCVYYDKNEGKFLSPVPYLRLSLAPINSFWFIFLTFCLCSLMLCKHVLNTICCGFCFTLHVC